MSDIRTFAPRAEIIKEGLTFTKDHFIYSMHNWPFNWYEAPDNLGVYRAPVYNVAATDHSLGFPSGNPNMDVAQGYYSCGWFRNFYPNANVLWDTTLGLGAIALDSVLKELDFHENNNVKMILSGFWYHYNGSIWGLDVDTVEYERELILALTTLLTDTTLSPNGHTFANHPALGAIEFANESVNTSVVAKGNSYARATRIITTLFNQYTNAKVVTFSGQGGNGASLGTILNMSAVSIDSPLVAVNGDDGTGKTTADYLDVHCWHYYQSSTENQSQLLEAIANNKITTSTNIDLMYSDSMNPILAESLHNSNSPLFGRDTSTIPYWNTESGIAEQNTVSAINGGARFYKLTYQEEVDLLLKCWGVAACLTQDGVGNPGLTALYKQDLPAVPYSGALGTNGTISNIQAGVEGIRVTMSGSGPSIGWDENMCVMITAPVGGWADLGLAEGEKKRFDVHVVDLNANILELKGTEFTEAVTGTPTYTEFQFNHSPSPEAWIEFIRIMTSGTVTLGLIHNEGSPYQGIALYIEGEALYIGDVDGNLKQW